MPTRLLYEKICVSETMAALTAEEERFFTRLLVKCDDHGRFYASPAILLGHLFSLQLDSITPEMVREWRDRVAAVGLIHVYESGGREYLEVATWSGYQRQRGNKPRFPGQPDDIDALYDPDGLLESVDRPQSAADCGESPQIAARASSRPGTYSGDLLRGLTPGTLPSAEGGAGGAAVAADGADAPPTAPAKAERPKRKKAGIPVPEEFPLEEKHFEYAAGYGLDQAAAEHETAQFLRHHRFKGTLGVDWYAGWQNWIRDSVGRFAPRGGTGHRNGSSRPPPSGPNRPPSALEAQEPSRYLETREAPLRRR